MIQVPSEMVAPISPWICGRDEVVIEVSSVTMAAPMVPATTAIQARRSATGSAEAETASVSAIGLRTRIDRDGHGQSGQQRRAGGGVALDADANRDALDDLGEIAGRVLGRQQGKLGAGA